MNFSKKGTLFLKEFKDFITFLQNLWGILAGISILFPLSNVLLKLIPLKTFNEDGVYNHLSPSLITTIATVVSLFVILWTFSSRNTFKKQREISEIQKKAFISFVIGIMVLIIYLVIYIVTSEYAWSVWGWGTDDPRKLFAEVPLLITYSSFFALTTRAFMLLGMIEFFRKEG
jgi:uncharacterized membrane protein